MLRHVLIFLLVSPVSFFAEAQATKDSWIKDEYGAVVRGDVAKKNIALVFSGDEHGDGTDTVLSTLRKYNVPASFFLSRKFYTNEAYKSAILKMMEDGHYIGLHAEKTVAYTTAASREKTLITEAQFKKDLHENYKHLAPFGIHKHDVLFFLPSCDSYNSKIVKWCEELQYPLIFGTPGTLLQDDKTTPEDGTGYKSSEAIYKSVLQLESSDPHQLNGSIMVIHIGTDSTRTDKFYHSLGDLIEYLDHRGYEFVEINELLE